MSWTSDVIDDLILALQQDGSVKDLVKDTSIKKGLEDEFPGTIPQNQFPIIRVTWAGTDEEDEGADNLSERYISLNLTLHLAVYEIDEGKRLDRLSDLEEVVKNAIYRHERSLTLVNDEIDVSSTEVAPDLFPPFGLAIMNVTLRSYDDRDARNGR